MEIIFLKFVFILRLRLQNLQQMQSDIPLKVFENSEAVLLARTSKKVGFTKIGLVA